MATAYQQAWETLEAVRRETARGLVGQRDFVDALLLGILADGHLLIEGVPGLAKTRAVNLLARICRIPFKRIQFTPDLLPADITGNRVYNHSTASFETQKGPIFAGFILADEINRAPAKVQSALLEAMQEKQVTIGDQTFPLPEPFFVFATQNPIEQEGTYPLPEAQLDRFLIKVVVPYPTPEEETAIIRMVTAETGFPEVRAILEPATVTGLQQLTREVYLDDKLVRYIAEIVHAGRDPSRWGLDLANVIQYGPSPRGGIALAKLARARAVLCRRDATLPDDVKAVAHLALRHRVILTYHADAEGIRPEQVIDRILEKVRVP